MPPVLNKSNRAKALHALKEAEAFIQGTRETVDFEAKQLVDVLIDEGQRMHAASTQLVLALLTDEYTPLELFKPWASSRTIRNWRDDPAINLDVCMKLGRCCIKPSVFFAHWRTLKQ